MAMMLAAADQGIGSCHAGVADLSSPVSCVSRQTEYDANVVRPLLLDCVAICKSCGDECEHHAGMHEHCRVCAVTCRRCEQARRELLGILK